MKENLLAHNGWFDRMTVYNLRQGCQMKEHLIGNNVELVSFTNTYGSLETRYFAIDRDLDTWLY